MDQKIFHKVDEFIQKYYKNELLKGTLIFSSILLGAYFLFNSIEYFGRLNSFYRGLMFYSFLLGMLWYGYHHVIKPLLFILKVKKGISHEQAAKLIGEHFDEVDDKLLNTLQLFRYNQNNELLLASIEQKSMHLSNVPFAKAINLRENKRYLKYFLPILFVFLIVWISFPNIYKEGTKRLVYHTTTFAEPAPFEFILENKALNIPKNQTIELSLKIEGEELPNSATVNLSGVNYKMNKTSNNTFTFAVKSVQNSFDFHFSASGFNSNEYKVNVFALPTVHKFNLYAQYPDYTGLEDQSFTNIGDIIVPEGTKLSWEFFGRDMDQLSFVVDSNIFDLSLKNQSFFHELTAKQKFTYAINGTNKNIVAHELFSYEVDVLKDASPFIKVEQDVLDTNIFSGVIRDDYGFSKFSLVLIKENKESFTEISFNPKNNFQSFTYQVDPKQWNILEGTSATYFFRVYDNDQINGSKYTDSKAFVYNAPSKKEIREEVDENAKAIKSSVQKDLKELKEINKSINDLKKDLQQKKEISWEDKKKLQDLLKRQQQMEERFNALKDQNKENNEKRNELTEKEEELLKKQEQIEELFEQIFDDETKKMLEEIQRMMEELNKEELQEKLEDMELSNEQMEKELDRTLELFKQLEFELQLEETLEMLEELIKKQEDLSEQTKEADKEELEKLQEEQEKLNEEFKDVEKELEDLKEKNESLEQKNQMADTKESQEKTKQEQQEAKENMEKGSKKKASENQKNASEEMKKMKESLSMMQQQNQQQKQQENMEDLRLLLDNLIATSFQQEKLQEKLLNTHYNDPKYPQITLAQSNIRDETILISDSLFALSKRVPELESIVNKEMSAINSNLTKALEDLQNRKKGDASSRQQYVMTSLNNLSLILDEVLQQMQEEMKKEKFGNSACSKPGSNPKPSFGSARQMQQKLNQQMKEMQEQMMKQGQKPGGKDGKEGGGNEGSQSKSDKEMSEKIAKLAAEQGAIREQVQKLMQELEKKQQGDKGDKAGEQGESLNELLEEMEQMERDLYNKNFTPEMIKRQQEILTRLLEAETAEREQDWDDKRESSEGEKEQESNQNEFLEYKRLKEKEAELLKSIPPSLQPFYKEKANEYLNNVEE